MKVCPICGSTYDAGVDFCFKDGAPLDTDGEAPSFTASGSYRSALSEDELDAPDAISLSNIPAVDYDDESAVTQTLPTDLPEAEEFDRTTVEGLKPVPELDHDTTGIVDPFGGHEEEAFRARLAEDDRVEGETTDGDVPAPTAADDPSDDVDAAAAPAPDEGPTEPASKAAAPVRKAATPKKPADSEDDDNKGLFIFIGIAALLLVGFIGWKAMSGGGEPTPEPVATSTSTPAPQPERTPEPTPEPEPETPEQPEGEGDEASAEAGDDDDTADDAAGETDSGSAEADETPAAGREDSSPSAAELRARQDERREREERRRRDREERERRAREAARDDSSGSPEPPFSAGEEGGDGGGAVAADSNPWGAGAATPAPENTPASGGNPWGASAASESQVTIGSQPAGARVTVGGRYRGQAPVALSLPAGTHEVRVEQQGHATQTRYVKVADGAPVSVDVVLEPLVRVAQGTVMVASSPPAMLYVDGVAKGKTPISVALAAGSHTFRLDADGKPSFEQTLDIQLSDGETVNRFFQLPD
ncbi:MAG: PEGA domain-containing protein [Proteobacteria bacterium]|nr:PEGA domain-containing protein [Pseudomonadota bacterium]